MRLPYRKPGKYSQIKKDPHITQQRYDKLQADLAHLQKKHPSAAAEVSRLAEMGDFSENAAYQLAKGRLRGINNAILKIEAELKNAIIIQGGDGETVVIGSTVTVELNGKEKTYTILGSSEVDPANGIISHLSPVGKELIGKKVGDEIKVRDKILIIQNIS